MQFGVLGSLRVMADDSDEPAVLTARLRVLMAALLWHANQPAAARIVTRAPGYMIEISRDEPSVLQGPRR